LRATDVALDYDAVMSSRERLRLWSQTDWPADDFTLEQNLADLERHEREHGEGSAFTFTVLDPEGTRCLGCAYFTAPGPNAAPACAGATHPVQVGFWVRDSEIAAGLDRHLFATLRAWLPEEWAFDRVLFGVSPRDARQVGMLMEAGLERRAAVTLADGRPCWLFGESATLPRPR
jgi:hypothetical protein